MKSKILPYSKQKAVRSLLAWLFIAGSTPDAGAFAEAGIAVDVEAGNDGTSNSNADSSAPTDAATGEPEAGMDAGVEAGVPYGWQLTFDDEFDGPHIDTCKWQFRHKWGERVVNHELEAYVAAAQADQAFTFDNGVLHIVASRQPGVYGGVTLPFTSGLLVSIYEQRYGYFETRSRMPNGSSGLWPAFWLLHSVGYPDIHEIDIMEWTSPNPNTVLLTNHFGTSYRTDSHSTGFMFTANDLSTTFHVYGVDWEPDRIVWYVDGVEVGRVNDLFELHDTPMYVITNLAVGGDLPGSPAVSATFPKSYDVDYVRVYQRDGSNPLAPPPFGSELPLDARFSQDAGELCREAGAGEAGTDAAEVGDGPSDARMNEGPGDTGANDGGIDDGGESGAVVTFMPTARGDGCAWAARASGGLPLIPLVGGAALALRIVRRRRSTKGGT